MLISANNIKSIEPVDDCVSITWMLGSRCNYDCLYCPAEFHDKTSQHAGLDTMIAVWHSFTEKTRGLNKRYKLSITGGEPTTNKNLIPLIEYIRQYSVPIKHINISSNGSASIAYYLKLAKLIDSISFSTHSEFFNEQEFFDKIFVLNKAMIRPEKSLHVNIMDEFWLGNKLQRYAEWCSNHGISYSVNTIDYTPQIRVTPLQNGTYNLASD